MDPTVFLFKMASLSKKKQNQKFVYFPVKQIPSIRYRSSYPTLFLLNDSMLKRPVKSRTPNPGDLFPTTIPPPYDSLISSTPITKSCLTKILLCVRFYLRDTIIIITRFLGFTDFN